jgi:hypothetical protein
MKLKPREKELIMREELWMEEFDPIRVTRRWLMPT